MAGDIVKQYVMIKRDLFECPGHMGYTGIRDKAGVWDEEYVRNDGVDVLEKYSRSRMEHYAIALDAAPEFTHACFEDVARNHLKDTITALRSRIEELERERDEAREKALDEAAKIADEAHNDAQEFGAPVWANNIASAIRALGKERT